MTKKIIIGIVSILSLYFGTTIFLAMYLPDFTTRGQFGDSFGVINALFSALAFLGIIITILLQKEELELQREEIKQNREELKRQADALENGLNLDAYTSLLNAYSVILNPTNGLKNRELDNLNMNEDQIRVEFSRTLQKIQSLVGGR